MSSRTPDRWEVQKEACIVHNNEAMPIFSKAQSLPEESQPAIKSKREKNKSRQVPAKEPKVYIKECDISDTDILFGRGGRGNNHPGNKIYLQLVRNAQQQYKELDEFTQKKEKRQVSRSIVSKLQQQHGSRFLCKEPGTHDWYEVTFEAALSKTSQALRDPSPKERVDKKQAQRRRRKAAIMDPPRNRSL